LDEYQNWYSAINVISQKNTSIFVQAYKAFIILFFTNPTMHCCFAEIRVSDVKLAFYC